MDLGPIFQLGAVFLLILSVLAIILMGGAALRLVGKTLLTTAALIVSFIRLPFDAIARFLKGK